MNDTLQPGTIRINDVDLTYIEHGSGDPLVFVHGSVSDYRTWEPQLEAFAARYRVVSYSRRYHWPNAIPPEGTIYRAMHHADDLIALVESLGIAPAHAVCESNGGVIALAATIQRPDLFRSLVLGEASLFNWLTGVPGEEELMEAFVATVFQPSGQAFRRGDAREGIRIFLDGVIGEGTFDSFSPADQDASMNNVPEMRAETGSSLEDVFPLLPAEHIARLRMPVLLVEGEHSPPIFGAITNKLARVLPHAERVTIPDASHIMNAQNPEAYNATVLDFLSRHQGVSGT